MMSCFESRWKYLDDVLVVLLYTDLPAFLCMTLSRVLHTMLSILATSGVLLPAFPSFLLRAYLPTALLLILSLRLFLGVLLGGVSGYRGGFWDSLIQRLIEFLRSIPTIPLWLGLSAAVPKDWSVIQIYFAITLIISFLGWTTLAREVRGRFLAMRQEDFVVAARLYGTHELRIIFRHMVPSFMSHIIATTTLAVPAIIIAETSLSFLGLGLRPPAISWGTLLFEAQNLNAVANAPWLMIPGPTVLIAVLAFNFAGDGIRDATDPYSNN